MEPGTNVAQSAPMAGEATSRGWSSGAILRAAAIVLGLWFALRFAWTVRPILMVAFLGVLFGIVLSAAAARLERFHIRRGIAVPSIVLLTVGLLVGLGFLMAPSLRDQARELQTRLPQLIAQLEGRLSGSPVGRSVLAGVKEGAGMPAASDGGEEDDDGAAGATRRPGRVEGSVQRVRQLLFPAATAAIDMITGLVILVFVAIFVGINPGLYRRGLIHLVPASHEGKANEVLDALGDSLRQWLVARLLAMVAVGVITGVTLAVIGVPAAALLGVIAGLLEFIPFFGPVAAAVPAIGMALVEGPEKALWTAAAFLVIQQLEGNLITPLLLQNRVDIPPLLTILTVPALMIVLGLSGGLVAEPLLATVLVLFREIWLPLRERAGS